MLHAKLVHNSFQNNLWVTFHAISGDLQTDFSEVFNKL